MTGKYIFTPTTNSYDLPGATSIFTSLQPWRRTVPIANHVFARTLRQKRRYQFPATLTREEGGGGVVVGLNDDVISSVNKKTRETV